MLPLWKNSKKDNQWRLQCFGPMEHNLLIFCYIQTKQPLHQENLRQLLNRLIQLHVVIAKVLLSRSKMCICSDIQLVKENFVQRRTFFRGFQIVKLQLMMMYIRGSQIYTLMKDVMLPLERKKLSQFCLVNEFNYCLPEYSSQYELNFVHKHNITFSLQKSQEIRRFIVSFSSNIEQWFRSVYQPTISTAISARSLICINETSVNWDIQQKTAKVIGIKRRTCIPQDSAAGHICMDPTISPESHQPPTPFIISLLKTVSETPHQLSAADDCQSNVSDKGKDNCYCIP
ncbi:MAG: hypothetical protein EZS28_011685 [Streblomastix strix]|uniref:Uncharacterized protein n=1 Tax=Streblomastix strix TaxID=222440 RepID=A0A5J4WCU3_9EUKA|nr:MAG: hypothetical protein EZS28_011685 [Streblomastix strix]